MILKIRRTCAYALAICDNIIHPRLPPLPRTVVPEATLSAVSIGPTVSVVQQQQQQLPDESNNADATFSSIKNFDQSPSYKEESSSDRTKAIFKDMEAKLHIIKGKTEVPGKGKEVRAYISLNSEIQLTLVVCGSKYSLDINRKAILRMMSPTKPYNQPRQLLLVH